MFPLGRILGLGQFLVAAVGNHAYPLRLVLDLVNFETHSRIRPHPFGLLSEGREDVYVGRLVRKIYRHHIRLVIKRAAESSERSACQKCATLFLVHFSDHHSPTSSILSRDIYISPDSRLSTNRLSCHVAWLEAHLDASAPREIRLSKSAHHRDAETPRMREAVPGTAPHKR